MICSKCNSEIPEGSRFCSVCGAACGEAADVKPAVSAQQSSGKYHCAKCGLELEQGAKFCTACGEPAANVGNVAPIVNSGETFGNGNMSAVSLAKEPDASDLVAAMNTAANAPVSAPAASAVPTPVPAPSAVPTPAPSSTETQGFAPSGNTGYIPSAVAGGLNGMSGAAAAVMAPPAVKKKGSGAKIALIIAIVLVLLIGGAAVFFFTNKAAALSLVMGKPKYAALVEKQSLKEASEKLDTKTLSEQIKTLSALMYNEDMFGDALSNLRLSNSSSDPKTVKLMSLYGADAPDVKGILKGYSDFMKSSYGASRIYGTVTANISLGEKLKEVIGYYDYDEVKTVLDIMNGAEFTYDVGCSEKLLGTELGIKLNGKPINVKAMIEDNGTVYAMFPFASDKAFKYEMETGESAASSSRTVATLELDEEEISRLLSELVEVYTDYIKDSSVTMEKGGLIVSGISVEGKEITAEIGGEKLEGLITALCEHIANDEYFCNKIVEYAKNLDPDYTADDYKNDILDMAPAKGAVSNSDKLVVTSIVNNSGKVLAKSYKAVSGSKSVYELLLAENSNTGAVEFKEDDKTTFTALCESTSDTDGKITLNVGTDDDEAIGIIVTYSGAGKEKFGNIDVATGSYTLKFDVSGIKESLDEDEKDILGKFGLDLSTSVSGGTLKYKAGLDIKDYITADVSMDFALSDDMSKFTAPANAINLEDAMYGLDENAEAQLEEFGMELLTGLQDALKGTPLEDLLSASLLGSGSVNDNKFGGFGGDEVGSANTTGSTAGNGMSPTVAAALDALEDEVWDASDEVYEWIVEYDVYIGDAFDNAYDYWEKLDELEDRIWDVYDTCTAEQLAALQKEFKELTANKEAIRKALEAAASGGMNMNMTTTAAAGNAQSGHHSDGHHSGGSHHDSSCPNGSHCTLGHNCPYYA